MLLPADYGVVALVMVFITIANVFVSNGFGSALIQKKDADNLDFSSVFYINIAISLVLYTVLFFAAPYIASFYSMPVLSLVVRILGIRIIIAAVNSIQQAYVSREMLFKRFFLVYTVWNFILWCFGYLYGISWIWSMGIGYAIFN